MAIITGLTGGLGIYFSAYVGEHGENVGEKLSPLGNAAVEIKFSTAAAQLWIEEIVSRDREKNIQIVWDLLNRSIWYCDAILEGGVRNEKVFFPTEDPQVKEKIEVVKQKLLHLIDIDHQRYEEFQLVLLS